MADIANASERAAAGHRQPAVDATRASAQQRWAAAPDRASAQPLLEVEDLRVDFSTYAGVVHAVRGASFSLSAGGSLAIVGESGCGKSVTAKAVMGLVKEPGQIEAGSRILFDGEDTSGFDAKRWQRYHGSDAAIVFQEALSALDPTMRVGKQIAEPIWVHEKVSKKEALARAIELLREVGIPEHEKRARQFPHELSGGMRQRAMIASAIACEPRLLVCDEPTTALDVSIQDQILEMIRRIRDERGTAIIMITHDMGVVADIAQDIAVMYAGLVVERGRTADVFERPRHPYTAALLAAMPEMGSASGGRLRSIPGAPPDLINPPKGCPFAARCAHAMPVCAAYRPAWTDFGDGHEAACWLHDPRAPQEAATIQEGEVHGDGDNA